MKKVLLAFMLLGAMSAQADDVMKKEKDGTYIVNTTTLAQDVEGYNGPTAVVITGLSPAVSNDYLALMPIFFAAPVQWNAFCSAAGYTSSTIFSSNNLRIATTSLTSYIMTKDEAQRDKAKFYWATLLFFHIGVALSCFVSLLFSTSGIWFAFIPLFLTAFTYFYKA